MIMRGCDALQEATGAQLTPLVNAVRCRSCLEPSLLSDRVLRLAETVRSSRAAQPNLMPLCVGDLGVARNRQHLIAWDVVGPISSRVFPATLEESHRQFYFGYASERNVLHARPELAVLSDPHDIGTRPGAVSPRGARNKARQSSRKEHIATLNTFQRQVLLRFRNEHEARFAQLADGLEIIILALATLGLPGDCSISVIRATLGKARGKGLPRRSRVVHDA